MLDTRKQEYIRLKLEFPALSNAELAKRLGVSRQATWEWSKLPEVQAELDRRLQEINRDANKYLKARTGKLMDAILDLALNKKTEARVRNSALQYLIDRSLGKSADTVDINMMDCGNGKDALDAFKQFLESNGYETKDGDKNV